MRSRQRVKWHFFFMVVLLVFMIFGSLQSGFTGLNLADVFRILAGGGTERENLILFDLRLVRIVLAVLVGVGLSVSGTIFQTISKNTLASPDLLGVSAGAGMAVMLYTFLELEGQGGNVFLLPVVSLCGALLTCGLIYGIAHRKGEAISPMRMVLIGVSITAGMNAADILTAVRLSPEKFHLVNAWMIGRVYGNSWKHVLVLLPWVAVLIPALFLRAKELELLHLKDEVAIGLGAALKRSRLLYLMMAAACVSVGGAIDFVGLICPHLASKLMGAGHRRRIPAAALLGAILLLGADWIARTVIAPDEMLLGIVVSLVGAPYFLYILLGTGKKEGGML